ncbi:hypothetical protein L3X38_037462 [Prunus dulcis]|uniref:Uncharacterized protein n=1 Tax=Prunus dulcis TaxID=3755 RepID=A0AAD4YQN6_PRUDU|nr:hypothetical protein L3X38_037462 [Prunus dulcis]
MSKSRHSDLTHHRFTHTFVSHSFSVHDSPHPEAVILACRPSLGDICIPNVPHNHLCIAWGRNPCVPASEYLASILDKAEPKPSPSSIVKCLASRWHSKCHMLTLLFFFDAQYERPCVFVLSSGIPFPWRHRLSFNNLMPALMTFYHVTRMLA